MTDVKCGTHSSALKKNLKIFGIARNETHATKTKLTHKTRISTSARGTTALANARAVTCCSFFLILRQDGDSHPLTTDYALGTFAFLYATRAALSLE